MSTYKARTNAANRFGITRHRLMATTAITAASLVGLGISSAHAQNVAPDALPQGATVTQGSADYDYNGNTLTITQHDKLTSAEYAGGFNIGRDASVFVEQETDYFFVHIDRSDNTSYIEGLFAGKGGNAVLNKNGVLVTSTARINMNTFIGSTAESIDTSSFADDGKIIMSDFGNGSLDVESGAEITITEGGLAAFVGPNSSNAGTINAKLGTVAFAAGETVTVDLYGDGLFEIAVEGELEEAVVENTGTINAHGGTVRMDVLAAKDTVDNLINLDGVVDVSSATAQGGKIILNGGNSGVVTVAGNLNASGATGGGEISVTGQNVDVAETAVLTADAGENGNGGTAYIYGNDYAIFRGLLSATGGSQSGDGGNAEISAGKTVGYYGLTDLSSTTGTTGTLLIDPRNLTINNNSTSGVLADLITGGTIFDVNVNARALANTLTGANVNLWATESISTGDDIDLSVGTERVGTTYGGFLSGCFFGCPVYADTITEHDLNLAAPTVNLLHDITLGTGALNVNDLSATDSIIGLGIINPPHDINVDTLNLDGKIYTRSLLSDPAFTELASDAQINTDADVINVNSNAALIQQAVDFADGTDGDFETINIAAGTYNESVTISKDRIIVNGVNAGISAKGGRLVPEETVVQGDGAAAFTISGDRVTLDGMTIEADDSFDAVNLDEASFATIKNNFIQRKDGVVSGNGIYVYKGMNNNINNNQIQDIDADGIRTVSTRNFVVAQNQIQDIGRHGVYIFDSRNSELFSNMFTRTGADGILALNGSSINVYNNMISETGDDGIDINKVQTSTITGNILEDIHDEGIEVSQDPENEIYSITTIDDNEVSGSDVGTGIWVENVVESTVTNNRLDTLAVDGIRVESAAGRADVTEIGYNEISNTYDDGIHVIGGAGATIYSNVIEGAGFNVDGGGLNTDSDLGDGIKVEGVGLDVSESPSALGAPTEYGEGSVAAAAQVKIYDNAIAIVKGDGIDAENNNIVYVNTNLIGHADDHGININGFAVTEVSDNAITSVGRSGINVRGYRNDDIRVATEDPSSIDLNSIYAGIFGNKVLLAGGHGVYVSGVNGQSGGSVMQALQGNEEYGDYGWNVNIAGNEVVMVGDDGIHAEDNGSTRIAENDVLMAGMGGDLEEVIDQINVFAAFAVNPPAFAFGGSVTQAVAAVEEIDPAFVWNWGEGNGIYVSGANTLGPNGWAIDVNNNNVDYTGGHGIYVRSGYNAIINDNTVNYAGVELTEHEGYDSMLDMLSSGPFAPEQHFGGGSPPYTNLTNVALNIASEYESWTNQEPSRRNLWVGQDLTETVGAHITPTDVLEYQTADGIHVFDVRTNEYPDIFEGPYSLADSEYNVVLQGNTISHTGDDGIDVNNITGRVLIGGADSEIQGNIISDAGYGGGSYYGAADYFGADGISVRNVEGDYIYPEWELTQAGLNLVEIPDDPSDEPVYYGYAVDILGNTIDITADDGIEVTEVESTLIQDNIISNVGVGIVDSGYYGYYGSYQPDGADGISVRNVGYNEGPIWVPNAAPLSAVGAGSGSTFIEYAVVIDGNDIDNTGDDGIEVVGAGRTLITGNEIDNVGLVEEQPYYGGYYGYYSDGFGGDAIHVRDVYQGLLSKPPIWDVNQLQAGGIVVPTEDYKLFAVDINHNVINRTGDDGIEVLQSGRTIIAGNEIADVGVNNEGTYAIGFGYSGTDIGSDEFNERGGSTSDYYGHGADGISVRDVFEEPQFYPPYAASLNAGGAEVPTETASSYDPYTLVIVGNDIDRTGDDGIEVVYAGRTLIAENEINNVGTSQHINGSVNGNVSYTNGYYGGYYASAASLSSLGDFLSETGTASVGGYLEISSGGFATDVHGADAIHVRGVNDESEYLPVSYAGGESGGVYSGYAVDIIGNTIDTTADDGIEVLDSVSTFISDNTIDNAGMGYAVSETFGNISGDYTSADGDYYGYFGYQSDFSLYGYGSFYISQTTGNDGGYGSSYAFNTGGDAIRVENVGNFAGPKNAVSAGSGYYGGGFEPYAVVVLGNTIDTTADDGIEVVESGRTRIEGNEIDNVGVSYYSGYGIDNEYSGFFDGYFGGDLSALDGLLPPGYYGLETNHGQTSQIGNASQDGYGNDAIHVRDVVAEGYVPDEYFGGSVGTPYFDGTSVEIFGNTINNVADDGIQVLASGNTVIGGLEEGEANTINNTGLADENYFGGEGYYSYVFSGEQDYYGGDGIHVKNGFLNQERSSEKSLDNEPYFLLTDVEIVGNEITNAGDDGIEVEGAYNLLVDKNIVTDSGDEGILILSGDTFERDYFGDVNNVQTFLVGDSEGYYSSIPDQSVIVSNNEVSGSGANGLHVQGSGHESVKVFGNTFTDNGGIVYDEETGEIIEILGSGARFESGQIDLTSDEEGETPNTIVNTTGIPAVGLQFENAPGILPSELTITDLTLGNTIFTGFAPVGSYYVRFEDGAILEDDDTVIVIDGTNANFDGIVVSEDFPSLVVPLDTLTFLEDRLFDADDALVNGRGQIFVGFPPNLTIDNFEDFIRLFGGPASGPSGLNLSITGLPPVQLGPQQFAGITPAAGGGTPTAQQLAGITPAAGGDGDGTVAPQDIEPAAGGNDVACWGDALASASNGTPVNFNFGGTFEESLADAAQCGSQAL